jgi:class 3 adenylate cyclase
VDNKKGGAYLLLVLSAIKLIADAALWVAIGALLVLFGLQFPHPAKLDFLWLIQRLHAWGNPALAEVASKFGWEWPSAGISLLPIGGGLVLLAAKQGFDALMRWLTGLVRKRLPLSDEAEELSSSASSMGISVSSTLLALAAVSDKARVKLERRQARVERRLREAQRRRCAFLSIDVVDAEEMKLEVAPEKIAQSFNAYEEMLGEVFQLTSAWKVAWTTDGVMVCFLDVRHALDAAQRVLQGLKGLNSRLEELRQPFRVRCGLNEGEVVIFEDSKLEKVADHVIDVAGHMQKKARPNTLWLSSEVYDHLEEKSGFRSADARVDGLTVLEWRA